MDKWTKRIKGQNGPNGQEDRVDKWTCGQSRQDDKWTGGQSEQVDKRTGPNENSQVIKWLKG